MITPAPKQREEFPKKRLFDNRVIEITRQELCTKFIIRCNFTSLQQVGKCRGVKRIGKQTYFVNDRSFFQYFNLN
jgi:hypothetical protein